MTKNSDTDIRLRVAEQANEKLINTLIDRDAEAALVAAGANPYLAKSILIDGAQVQYGHRGAFVRYRIGNSWGDAREAVVFMRENHPDRHILFAAISGEPGKVTTAIRNPWAKETFSLTEQFRLEKQNPVTAAQLKLAAGV